MIKHISGEPKRSIVYAGTYTGDGSKGIYTCIFNHNNGQLKISNTTSGIENPSYLALDSLNRHLYAVSEIGKFKGEESGAVYAYSINARSGTLKHINKQATNGAHPCYIALDKSDTNVLIANYTGGNVSVLPIRPGDQGLMEASDTRQHKGSGPNKERQQSPHAHSIKLTPDGKHALSADLGADKLMFYRFDPIKGELSPADQPSVDIKPGAGPRHFDFHPNGTWLYVINELNATITVLSYDATNEQISKIQTVPTIPSNFTGSNKCADIHVHPSGNYLYGSNRGHDSIVAYKINQDKGTLELIQHQSTQGKTPRNFVIEPTGNYLLAANKDTNNVVVFSINKDTGELKPTGNELEIPSPVCLRFGNQLN